METEIITGCWKLRKMEGVDNHGNVLLPWGEKVDGLLIYDPSGWMSLQIVKLSPQPDDPETFHSYFGRFEVDYYQKKVTHTIHASLKKEWNNSTQIRNFIIKENILILKSTPIEIAKYSSIEIVTTWYKTSNL